MTRKILLITAFILCVAVLAAMKSRMDMLKGDVSRGKADAIIVLAGPPAEDFQRLQEGVRLIEQGAGEYLILPLRDRAVSWSTLKKIYNIETLISPQQVLFGRPEQVDSSVQRYCGGTFSEAAMAMELMRASSLKSAMVVSSRYHIPRVRLAFDKLNGRGLVSLSYRPVGEPETGKLLSSAYALFKRCTEYGKFLTAFFVYPIGARIVDQQHHR